MTDQKPKQRLVLSGVRIRDEFCCPITYELMREPVIAADGHTYDRHAIETWFRSHHTSPKTGEVIDKTTLLPNHNLKRLIDDLVVEGGAGLYMHDESSAGRSFELIPHKVLIMKCLGPPDTDWNERRFHVSTKGALGGRRQPSELNGKSFIQFTDNTVSRRHFEIIYNENANQYFVKDLGSAGGTFIRIAFGKRQLLLPGMMLLMGKHQFAVEAVDEERNETSRAHESKEVGEDKKGGRDTLPNVLAADELPAKYAGDAAAVADAKADSKGLPKSQSKDLPKMLGATGAIDADDKTIAEQMENQSSPQEDAMRHLDISAMDAIPAPAPSATAGAAKQGLDVDEGSDEEELQSLNIQRERLQNLMSGVQELISMPLQFGAALSELSVVRSRLQHLLESGSEPKPTTNGRSTPPQADASAYESDTPHEFANEEPTNPSPTNGVKGYTHLKLTCFAPEQSPLQGKEYFIGMEGATVGRRSTNTIHFCHAIDDRYYGIDNSISAEHARILYDENLGGLVVVDGSPSKGSTNGTWQRLSQPATESEPYLLTPKTEVLIGTVRFQVLETDTLTEHTLE